MDGRKEIKIKITLADDYWSTDAHKLSRLNCLYCSCPYHEQLRADAEADRREQGEDDNDDTK